jgi:hypothetical protein
MSDQPQTALDEPIVFTHPAFSYLSPKIVLKRLPYGIGMFAAEVINKDELLIGWAGKVVHLKEVLALSDDERGHILQIDDYLFQIPFWPDYTEPADYTNHSCDPNAGFGGSPVTLVAMREIPVGEEITFDYAMCECIEHLTGNCDWECQCGKPHCRGMFTGADWKRPELWERYGNYFSPYLLKKINYLRSLSSATPATTSTVVSATEFPSIEKCLMEQAEREARLVAGTSAL